MQKHPADADRIIGIESNPTFRHSRLGAALVRNEDDLTPERLAQMAAKIAEDAKFFDEVAALGVVVGNDGDFLDFRDTTVAKEASKGIDDELERLNAGEREKTAVLATGTQVASSTPFVEDVSTATDGVIVGNDTSLVETTEEPTGASEEVEPEVHEATNGSDVRALFDGSVMEDLDALRAAGQLPTDLPRVDTNPEATQEPDLDIPDPLFAKAPVPLRASRPDRQIVVDPNKKKPGKLRQLLKRKDLMFEVGGYGAEESGSSIRARDILRGSARYICRREEYHTNTRQPQTVESVAAQKPERRFLQSRRRGISIAVAGVAVASIAAFSIFSIGSSNEVESITAGAPELTSTPVEDVSSGSTTTESTTPSTTVTTEGIGNYIPGSVGFTQGGEAPATTSTTTPEAQVSGEGVPGAVQFTREQYNAMASSEFANYIETRNLHADFTDDEFALIFPELVQFAELVEQSKV